MAFYNSRPTYYGILLFCDPLVAQGELNHSRVLRLYAPVYQRERERG